MRWRVLITLLAGTVSVLVGCTQQCFVTEHDLEHYAKFTPPGLDTDPKASLPPPFVKTMQPVTVNDPERRKPHPMTLAEAIAIGLEQGTIGSQTINGLGRVNDDLLALSQIQGAESTSSSLRVQSFSPSIAAQAIEAAQARFDAKWVTNMGWSVTDQQVQGLGSFQNGERADFRTGLVKPLAAGGLAGITFSTTYTNLQDPPQFFQIQNPAYLSRLDLTYDQPLLQGFGTYINQLLTNHPGSTTGSLLDPTLAAFNNSHIASIINGQGLGAGFGRNSLLVSRIRFDQTRADYERLVNYQILNIETAYWNLYGAYVNLYTAELGLRQAYETWRVTNVKGKLGSENPAIVARAQAQYHEFRALRYQSLSQVLESERQLRRLLGLRPEDGKQIVPIDAPTLAPFYPDWNSAVADTLTKRPELVAMRDELKNRQLDLIVQQNFLKPDLRARFRYGISGLGSRLDGNGSVFDASNGVFRSNNALNNLSDAHFNDWDIGLLLNIPLGYRFEHAAVRRARLGVVQTYFALKDEEQKAESILWKAYNDIFTQYNLIRVRRAQRLSAREELRSRLAKVQFGSGTFGDEFLLDAQRRFTAALQAEYQAVVSYNNALAFFQFAKGTIAQHNNVVINEGPLPKCAMVRAVVHEHERSRALLARERAAPVQHDCACPPGAITHLPGAQTPPPTGLPVPNLPRHETPSVPALLSGANLMPDASKGEEGTLKLPKHPEMERIENMHPHAADMKEMRAPFQRTGGFSNWSSSAKKFGSGSRMGSIPSHRPTTLTFEGPPPADVTSDHSSPYRGEGVVPNYTSGYSTTLSETTRPPVGQYTPRTLQKLP